MELVRVHFLTPYKIAILQICMFYCEGILDSAAKIPVMLQVLQYIDGSGDGLDLLDGDLTRLERQFSQHMCTSNSSVYYSLVESLWTDLLLLDDMQLFFHRINHYLEEPMAHVNNDEQDMQCTRVKPQSALGVFFRKCYLEFDRLTFEEISFLFGALVSFRGPNPYNNPGFLDNNNEDLGLLSQLVQNPKNISVISDDKLDALAEHHISLFQKNGASLSPKLRSLLDRLTEDNHQSVTLPSSIFYLRYLDACRNRDHQQALENLHHFYDYALDNQGQARYQYALFTLANMHAEFNSPVEAIKAAEEAIAVARQNMDFQFLTEILSWLYAYIENNPQHQLPSSLPSADQMAQFLRTKSWETSISLSSLAYQSDALKMMGNGTHSLSSIFESLMKSAFINVVSEYGILASSYCLVQSSLWSRCGIAALSNMYLVLSSPLSREQTNTFTVIHAEVHRIRQLLLHGHAAESCQAIIDLEPLVKNSVAYRQIWVLNMILIKAEIYLNERKLTASRVLLNKLKGMSNNLSLQLQFDAQILEIKLDYYLGNMSRVVSNAIKGAERVIQLEFDILYNIKFTILYIRALLKSRNPSRAFGIIIKSYLTAERASLVPTCCELLVLLAVLSCRNANYKDAITILDRVMPKLLETEVAHVIAEAYETLADALVGLAGAKKSEPRHTEELNQAYIYLISSGEHYQSCLDVGKGLEICAKTVAIAKISGSSHRLERMQEAIKQYQELLEENMAYKYTGV